MIISFRTFIAIGAIVIGRSLGASAGARSIILSRRGANRVALVNMVGNTAKVSVFLIHSPTAYSTCGVARACGIYVTGEQDDSKDQDEVTRISHNRYCSFL